MRLSSYLATAFTAIGFITLSAQAVDPNPGNYRTQANGTWDDPATWEVRSGLTWIDATEYPQGGDAAAVLQHAVTLDQSAQCATLDIFHDGSVTTSSYTMLVTASGGLDLASASGGTNPAAIIVSPDGTLQLSGGGEHEVDGEIQLQGSSGDFSTLSIVTGNSSFKGAGQVFGDDPDYDVISIGSKLTLMTVSSNPFDVMGVMLIQGAGEFDNDGKVTVIDSSGGQLKIIVSTVSGSGAWEASGTGTPILRFEVDAASLTGNFTLLNGAWFQFYSDADVVTSGTLTGTCGKIDVDGGGSFQHSSGTVTVDTSYGGYPACS